MAGFVESLVQSITIESAWFPTIQIDDPFAPGPPSPILQFVKPRITITPKAGSPIVSAPWGEPTENNWEYLKWVLVAGGGVMTVWLASLVVHRYVRPKSVTAYRLERVGRHGG
jgi:hypothetical protein